MIKNYRPLVALLGSILLLNAGVVSAAALSNAGFEAGNLSGYNQIGFISPGGGPSSGGPKYATYLASKSASGTAARNSTNGVVASQTSAFNGFGTNSPAIAPTQGGFLGFVSNAVSSGNGGITGSEISQSFDIPLGTTRLSVDLALLNNDDASSFADYDDFGGVALFSGANVIAQFNLDLNPASSANVHIIAGSAKGGFNNSSAFRTASFDVSSYQGKTITLVAYALNYGGDNLTETRLLIDNIILDQSKIKIAKPYDFNGDGRTDILWQDNSNNVASWLIAANGLSAASATYLSSGSSGLTLYSARADFNADGNADILWSNASGGYTLWLMNGASVLSRTDLNPGAGWQIVQVADFNGDGKSDLLWQHSNGSTAMWLMDGASPISSTQLRGAATGWIASNVADFNGDGKADLVWTHTDGSAEAWLMNGAQTVGSRNFLGPNTGWRISASGDFFGNGNAALLISHTNGSITAWLMNGLDIVSVVSFIGADTGWRVDRLADFNGDGTQDILWKHDDGRYSIWLMRGTTVIGGSIILGANSGYVVDQVGDYNGDGKADILWRNTSNGLIAMWLMDGATLSAASAILDGAGGWRPTQR